MATPYRFKRSAVSGKRPCLTDLEKGELALNARNNDASHLTKRRDEKSNYKLSIPKLI